MGAQVLDFSSNTFNFKSCSTVIEGKVYKLGLKSIAYSDTLETKAVQDTASRLPIGVVAGNYTPKGSLEWATREAYQEFIGALGPAYLEKTFPISVSYAEPGKRTITDKIAQCRLLGADLSASGSDAIPVKQELLILTPIQWGGISPIS